MTGMLALPEGCIAAVISFTTPRDACRLACVSTAFRSAADSDVVWDRFLRPEYSSSSSSSSTTWSALWKKELYFRTCHYLIHKGKMSFWFDLPSGKKCYMISARERYRQDADRINDRCWFSIPDANAKHHLGIPDCRFSELVNRTELCPYEIVGRITTSLLSPMTTYVTYLVYFVISRNRVWFEDEDEDDNPVEDEDEDEDDNPIEDEDEDEDEDDNPVEDEEEDEDDNPVEDEDEDEDDNPVEVSVGLVGSDNGQNRTIYFHREHQVGNDDGFYPKKRADGWMESELGEFFNTGDEDDELLMTIETGNKDNIVVQGIEIRPKKE